MALPPPIIKGKPWYEFEKDRWDPSPRLSLFVRYGAPVLFGLFLFGLWGLFVLPLVFEPPHPTELCSERSCVTFPADQYVQAESEASVLLLGLGGLFIVLGAMRYRKGSQRLDLSAADSAVAESPGEWSECSECGGPLLSRLEKERGLCDNCRVLPS